MTAERLQAIRGMIRHVPHVFASGGLCSDPSANADGSTSINWASGIPPVFAEQEADGGRRALLADLNCIGNLATRELYLLQHGGYHTFDMRVANMIGGYGYGAVLDWWQDSEGLMRKVRCVKEDGNCFTPLDDPEHGVNSPQPHWAIVDMIGQSTFKMADAVETEIVDPDYNYMFRGTNLLYIRKTQIQPGATYVSNTWTAPADVKLVADAMFHDSTGSVIWSDGTYYDLPNPCCQAWVMPSGLNSSQQRVLPFFSVTLVVTPPGGISLSFPLWPIRAGGLCIYNIPGNVFGPIWIPKGTTLKVVKQAESSWLPDLGFIFHFKFKVYKV